MEEITRRRQHIVPKFYLKLFSDEKGQLSVYDTEKQRYFIASPDKICVGNLVYETEWENADPRLGKYVHPNSIEIAFSEKEAQYKQLLDVLLNGCSNAIPEKQVVCMVEEKRLLAEFVANTFLRDPDVFCGIIDADYSIEEIKKIDLYDHTQELFTEMGWGSPDSFISHAIKQKIFEPSVDGSPAQKAVEQLLSMDMVFFRSLGPRFITSSHPVTLFDVYNKKIGKAGFVVYFPLSPEIMLMYTDLHHYRKVRNKVVEVSSMHVKKLNKNYLAPKIGNIKFLIAQEKNDISELFE